MKKKLAAIVLVCVLAFSLMACGSGSAASAGGDTASAAAASEAAAPEEGTAEEAPEIPLTQGEAVADAGDFTVTVPEGWLGAGDIDTDENGNYFIEPYYYILIKGGESAEDQGVKPTINIYYTSSTDAQTLHDNNISPTNENTELNITVGGKKCPAYHSVMSFTEDTEEPFVMEYDNVFIPVSDSSCIRVSLQTFATDSGETGISVSDKDVITIMESLKVK